MIKPSCSQLLYLIAVAACLTLCGCSHQEENSFPQQTDKNRQGAVRQEKAVAMSDFPDKTMASHIPAIEQPESEKSSNVPEFEVSFEPGNPVTGDRLKAKVKPIKASADEIPLTYIWSINGERIQESADPSLDESIKCGDFVELQVGLAHNPQNAIAACSTFIGNAPPTLTLASQNLNEQGLYVAQLEVSDPEQDQVDLQLTGSPTGMLIDSRTKTIEWPVGIDQQGAFDVEISAKDSRGAEILLTYQIKVGRQEWKRSENNEPSSAPAQ